MRSTRSGSKDEASGDSQPAIKDNVQPGGYSAKQVDKKLDFIISELKVIKSDVVSIRAEQKDIVKSIEHCYELINDNKKVISKHETEINSCVRDIELASNKVTSLKANMNRANKDIAAFQQYSRKNCVNVVGVPFQKNENIFEILKKVAQGIQFEFDDYMVDNCHRLQSKPDQDLPPSIRFVRNKDKQNFLQCKIDKGKLVASEVGWANNNQTIYINETMSPFNMGLFKKAKELQKKGLIKYVWFRGGSVFVRVDDKSKKVLISCVEDFDKVVKDGLI